MKKFNQTIFFFLIFSFIALNLAVLTPNALAYPVTDGDPPASDESTPMEGAPVENPDADQDPTCDSSPLPDESSANPSSSSCDNKTQVCLGVLTKEMCEDKSLLNGTFSDADKLCSVPETKFTFAKYLGAWLNHLLLPVGIAVSIVLIIMAGILYMISGTDPGKANLAKDIIFTVFIGLAFLLLARVIFGWVIG